MRLDRCLAHHNSAAAIVLYFACPTVIALLGRVVKPMAEWIDSSTTFTWLLKR